MKSKIYILLLLAVVFSCKSSKENNLNSTQNNFTTVKIDTLFQDKISIRAILVDKNKIWYAADKNRFGSYDLISKSKSEQIITKDTLRMEFRSIAQTSDYIFIINVGNPAVLYRFSKKTNEQKIVYQETDPKVFYDSMQFWNNQEGIAIGDPTSNCLSVIITRDGGNSWKKLSCDNLPKIEDGEAAFAASNTNIIVKNNKTWIVSGGKKSRVFYSSDKGNSWQVFETPIVQGEAMTGIFTADFYDEKTGIIAGGNYEKLNQNFGNKATTIDGGKTWKLIAENQGFGYASCIQYVPNSNGNQLVCVGASGIYCSNDKGENWLKLSDDKDLFTIRFINKNSAIAAGRNKVVKLDFN